MQTMLKVLDTDDWERLLSVAPQDKAHFRAWLTDVGVGLVADLEALPGVSENVEMGYLVKFPAKCVRIVRQRAVELGLADIAQILSDSRTVDELTCSIAIDNLQECLERLDDREAEHIIPDWNKETRKLKVNGIVIHEYRRPAENQTRILQEFQESGWPECIDDPIPRGSVKNPKKRLKRAKEELNTAQDKITFRCAGDGETICWKPTLTQ